MITFDKNHKCNNLGILDRDEVRAYILFLDDERARHIYAIEVAEWAIDATDSPRKAFDKALIKFYKSAIKRHEEDIKAIDVLITTLKGFYGI